MASGSKKTNYIPLGLGSGVLLTFLKFLYMLPLPSTDLRLFVSLTIDFLFFSYASAGCIYILYEYFLRRKKEEIGLLDIQMIIAFILSIGAYSGIKALFFTPF